MEGTHRTSAERTTLKPQGASGSAESVLQAADIESQVELIDADGAENAVQLHMLQQSSIPVSVIARQLGSVTLSTNEGAPNVVPVASSDASWSDKIVVIGCTALAIGPYVAGCALIADGELNNSPQHSEVGVVVLCAYSLICCFCACVN